MFRRAMLASLALLLALPAAAADRMWSYDPADAETQRFVDNGLTFVFDKGVFGVRMREVLATQARATAKVEPAVERELGGRLEQILPAGAFERDLYSVTDSDQGTAMVRAFCPGSSRGWLVFGALRERRGVTVHALGDDPASGKARHCATLNFSFRAAWTVAPMNPYRPDPRPQMKSPF